MATSNDPTGTPATAPPPVQMMQLLYGSLVPHLVTEVAPRTFGLTPLAATLRTGVSGFQPA